MSDKKVNLKKNVKKKKSAVVKSKVIVSAKKGEEFVLSDGVKLKTLKELADHLGVHSMHFEEHVFGNENHFSLWIEHVFKNKKLAEKVKVAEDVKDLRIEIYKFLAENLK